MTPEYPQIVPAPSIGALNCQLLSRGYELSILSIKLTTSWRDVTITYIGTGVPMDEPMSDMANIASKYFPGVGVASSSHAVSGDVNDFVQKLFPLVSLAPAQESDGSISYYNANGEVLAVVDKDGNVYAKQNGGVVLYKADLSDTKTEDAKAQKIDSSQMNNYDEEAGVCESSDYFNPDSQQCMAPDSDISSTDNAARNLFGKVEDFLSDVEKKAEKIIDGVKDAIEDAVADATKPDSKPAKPKKVVNSSSKPVVVDDPPEMNGENSSNKVAIGEVKFDNSKSDAEKPKALKTTANKLDESKHVVSDEGSVSSISNGDESVGIPTGVAPKAISYDVASTMFGSTAVAQESGNTSVFGARVCLAGNGVDISIDPSDKDFESRLLQFSLGDNILNGGALVYSGTSDTVDVTKSSPKWKDVINQVLTAVRDGEIPIVIHRGARQTGKGLSFTAFGNRSGMLGLAMAAFVPSSEDPSKNAQMTKGFGGMPHMDYVLSKLALSAVNLYTNGEAGRDAVHRSSHQGNPSHHFGDEGGNGGRGDSDEYADEDDGDVVEDEIDTISFA